MQRCTAQVCRGTERLGYVRQNKRPPFRVLVGSCRSCRVAFAARPHDREAVAEVLRVHEAVCPGGDRDGEIAEPFPEPPPSASARW